VPLDPRAIEADNPATRQAGINADLERRLNTRERTAGIVPTSIVLRDTGATPHFWQVSVTTAGVLTTTDLGAVS
jgi:hypothetical protein